MTLLYNGEYRKRFVDLFNCIKGESVVELCFGDTLLASMCRKKGISWKGYDLNSRFVRRALRKGFRAEIADVESVSFNDKAETCIISGSLYHFGIKAKEIIIKMLEIAPVVVISEPVKNISAGSGRCARFAAEASSAGKGPVSFRFSKVALLTLLDDLKNKHNFTLTILDDNKKDIIIVIHR